MILPSGSRGCLRKCSVQRISSVSRSNDAFKQLGGRVFLMQNFRPIPITWIAPRGGFLHRIWQLVLVTRLKNTVAGDDAT